MDTQIIAQRIKDIRLAKGLTQDTLGVRAGLTRSYISLLEAGKKVPAISTLYKLSNVLGVNIGDFFDSQSDSPRIVICRESERVPVSDNTSFGYGYEALATEKKDKIMDPFYVKVSPGRKKTEFVHKGEEFMYVTEGTLKLAYGDREYILEKGDSVYIDSSTTHKLESADDKPVYVLSINAKKL